MFGGLLTTLSVPPFGWWPLAILGIACLTLGLMSESAGPVRRAKLGLLFGLGLYVPSLWWMAQFTLPGAIFVAALESVVTGLAFVAIPRRCASALVPAGLVLADCLRSLWPFGGLPLGGIDLGQAAGPLAATAGLGGRLLLIGVTATIGTFLAHAGQRSAGRLRLRTNPRIRRSAPPEHAGQRSVGGPRPRMSARVSAGVLVAAVVAIVATAHTAPNGTHLTGRRARVAIVQGGGPRGQLASDEHARTTYAAHLTATRTLRPTDRVNVVLWPENTVAVSELKTSPEAAELQGEARRLGADIAFGATEDIDDRSAKNEEAVIDPARGVVAQLEKVRRVPYGEYFPFRNVIKRFYAGLPHRDFRPGTRPGYFDAAGVRFAVAISYEGFFDDRTRGGVRAGGQAILIPTNASSYTTTQVPTQQMAAARLRAIETGREVVQAAPTGLSAVVSPSGAVRWRSTIEARQTHIADVELRSGLTPYARWNDVPMLILLGLALATGWTCEVAKRRR